MSPCKYLRLGYTETTLLFCYWLRYHHDPQHFATLRDKNLEGWLYNTSGFYDTTQPSADNIKRRGHNDDSASVYRQYFERLLAFLPGAAFFNHNFHKIPAPQSDHIPAFLAHLNFAREGYLGKDLVLPLVAGKRILIISPFAPLMAEQVNNGNYQRIHDFAPPASVTPYRYLYTFFNQGPHGNLLETAAAECAKIEESVDLAQIDLVLISCGAYSCLLAQHFFDKHQKDVCTVGRALQSIFGYINKSSLHTIPTHKQPFYLTEMPPEYIPKGAEQIENACYW